MLSDADLTWLAQRGEAVSLGLLLERYRAPLYALALRMLGYGPQAEDAVQETFIIAMRKIGQVREPAAVGGWLHVILRNVCYTQLREDRAFLPLDGLSPRAEKGFSESSAEESIDQLAMREWVWTALAELPEALRVTAMLRYFGSYPSYGEISAILSVPVGTVRSRLNQVKIKLADALLDTAGLAHDEAGRLAASRRRYFTDAITELRQGRGYDDYASGFSEDLTGVLPGGTIVRGREVFAKEAREDMEAGLNVRITNLLASKDITIIEADFENPPDDPSRCPPATTQVAFYSGGRISRMHLYFAPRPKREVVG